MYRGSVSSRFVRSFAFTTVQRSARIVLTYRKDFESEENSKEDGAPPEIGTSCACDGWSPPIDHPSWPPCLLHANRQYLTPTYEEDHPAQRGISSSPASSSSSPRQPRRPPPPSQTPPSPSSPSPPPPAPSSSSLHPPQQRSTSPSTSAPHLPPSAPPSPTPSRSPSSSPTRPPSLSLDPRLLQKRTCARGASWGCKTGSRTSLCPRARRACGLASGRQTRRSWGAREEGYGRTSWEYRARRRGGCWTAR